MLGCKEVLGQVWESDGGGMGKCRVGKGSALESVGGSGGCGEALVINLEL